MRSFADSNDDGIGDLAGIRSRLPYLAASRHRRDLAHPVLPLAASRSRVRHRRLLRHRARLRRPRRVRRACPGGPSERHPDHDGRGPQPLQLRPRLVPRGRDGWARVSGASASTSATVEAPQGTSRRTTGRRSSAARPGPGSTSRTAPWAVVPRIVHTRTAGLRLEPPRCRRPLRPHAALLARPRRRRLPRRLGDGRRQGTWSPRPRVAPKRRSIGAGSPEPALRLPARRPCGVAPLAPRGRRLRGGASRAAGGAGGRGLHTTASRLDESVRERRGVPPVVRLRPPPRPVERRGIPRRRRTPRSRR